MLFHALLSAALAGYAVAHGSHGGSQGSGGAPHHDPDSHYPNWMTQHMSEEHHMDGWDIESFFGLHDYDSDGYWRAQEMQRTYGLMDPSNKHMTYEQKEHVLKQLLELMDTDGDNAVSREEWKSFIAKGETLPDLGTGPGHHGDDEYEYEIHHWEKYHDDNTKLEDLTHPEDIEHFKMHEEMEDAERKLEEMDKKAIIEENIPAFFRRH